MNKISIPHELKEFNRIFSQHGYKAYLVGGAVRDTILGKKISDWDVTTDATPQEVIQMFKVVIPTGIAHGTVTVHFMKHEIEVTTFRADQGYSDGRHPDKIIFAKTIEDDLSRRDFTMNAIAADLSDGSIVDPFNGQKDIKAKLIKTVGNPHERFMEDGLRPLRGLRFSSQLDFDIDKDTFNEIFNEEVQKKIGSVSLERFRDEFEKILRSPKPSHGLRLMEQTGVLKIFIPELAECRGVEQADDRGYHEMDVLDHCLTACDGAPQDNLAVRYAALFHDIGKKETRKEVFEENPSKPSEKIRVVHFFQHENVSEKLTRTILTRIKLSNAQIDKICHLVKEHMFYYEKTWSDAAVRRFIIRIGIENIDDLFDLRRADTFGKYGVPVDANSETALNLLEFSDRIKKIESEKAVLNLKSLAVNGKDLIEAGIAPGKTLGHILNELFQCVVDDPDMNSKEKLLPVALNLYKKISG